MVSYTKGGMRAKDIWKQYPEKKKNELKRDENLEWIRLHNEELHNLYLSPNKNQGNKM